ncbi:phage major capsid protein [Mycobacterium avium subsp. hominissuis]|uniref:phage major capsid protein n=1 Tax=Mycobacterium avium TaxID=1764 RepID=UPI0009FE7F26|nr:phage major capsid protein [Mycobacterium avium]PBJ58303.1 phage major capsid protein [Mycobacterium avium subsp. hominissuis]
MSKVITPTSPEAWALDVLGLAPEQTIPQSILIQATTKAGEVEGDDVFVRVPMINLDADTGFVPEGNDIPEADPDLSELVIATGKVAVLVRISREQLVQPAASEVVSNEIRRSVLKKVDWALLQQPAPVAPATFPPAGLIAKAAVTGAVVDNLDAVVDAVASIEALGGSCTNIVASPDAWAFVAKLKTATESNQSLIGAGVESAQRTLLSIPVNVTSAMPSGFLLALDKTKTLSAYGSIQVARSEHAYFNSDSWALRATLRFGAGFTEAGAGVLLTVPPPTP